MRAHTAHTHTHAARIRDSSLTHAHDATRCSVWPRQCIRAIQPICVYILRIGIYVYMIINYYTRQTRHPEPTDAAPTNVRLQICQPGRTKRPRDHGGWILNGERSSASNDGRSCALTKKHDQADEAGEAARGHSGRHK